jgi:putative SOS response-associated peptidase YedK
MFVVFQSNQYDEWLHCSVKEAPGFFTRYPAENLVARPVPKPSIKPRQETLLHVRSPC